MHRNRIIKMENDDRYAIEWVSPEPDQESGQEDLNDLVEEDDGIEEEYLVDEEIIPSTEINTIPNSLDQIAAENLIYMAHDGNVEVMGDLIEEQVDQVDNADYNEHQYFECQVTEEVITDDWVQQQGEERVEIPVDQLGGDVTIEHNIDDVPLPTDQDEYTASRPYPCDFCSRRFRKKANLMNHMMAHKNDRPHICNLCGARYIRRVDLLTHLKIHAQIPEHDYEDAKHEIVKVQYRKETKPKPAPKPRKPKEKKVKAAKVKNEYIEEQNVTIEENQQHLVDEKYVPRYPVIDPSRPFVCQRCGVSFAREKALMSHSKMHVSDSPYECDNCSEMFWDIALLREHQKIHHAGQSSNSEYEPEENDKDYSDSDIDSKYGEFYCSNCGMSFHRNELLKRHQSKCALKNQYRDVKYMSSNEAHCCNVCGESFVEALDLLAHAEVHARVQPYKCTLCGETFMDESSVKRHISTIHANEINENTCRLCGKQCRDGRLLMKHSWEHSREKNHSCSKCGKTFHNKARLKRHMQSHRNKSVVCEVCNKNFPDGRTYMNHRHSHNFSRQFPCKDCNKTFGSRSSQQIHMRIHTGERPYGCRFCWKAFADGGTLRKHERIHTGEKPYACPICPRAFNQRVVLREHIRSHHSGPDSKHSNSVNIFSCSVCGDSFATSPELVQHLIEHSDLNTAMKRQPPTGPRKYKRRRKLKPHELERLRTEKAKTSDLSDDELNNFRVNQTNDYMNETEIVNIKREFETSPIKPKVEKREKKLSFSDCSFSVFCNLENALQNIEPLVMPSSSGTANNPPSSVSNTVKPSPRNVGRKRTKADAAAQQSVRPKMIHTEKTRVPIVDGKRKSKTLITRTAAKDMNLRNRTSGHSRSGNVSSHINQNNRLQNLENDISLNETDLLLELSKKKIKYSPDVVNDLEEILRSPIKTRDTNDEYMNNRNSTINTITTKTTTTTTGNYSERSQRLSRRNQQNMEMMNRRQATPSTGGRGGSTKAKGKASSSSSSSLSSPNKMKNSFELQAIKKETESNDEEFTCEMCAAVFKDRAQLLVHVPIHI